MPGSFTITPGTIPLGRSVANVAVLKRVPPGNYTVMSNVRVLSIDCPSEGADPGSARFRYAFKDPYGDPAAPSRIEQLYGLDATGPLVLNNGDEVVVQLFHDDGTVDTLFDGYFDALQADLAGQTESATFECRGRPIREWDFPLGGALMRDADAPTTVSNIQTDLPARFNPDGHPNATPFSDTEDPSGTATFRVFLGPVWPSNTINSQTIKSHSLQNVTAYIIAQGNPTQVYTSYGDLNVLTVGLLSYEPTTPGAPINMADPSTYTTQPIDVEDIDIRGAAWPDALARLLEPHGFAMRFRLQTDASGQPSWNMDIYRKDDLSRVKSLYLQEAVQNYDPTRSNVLALKLSRDIRDVATNIILDTAPVEWECSFILVPLFKITAGDAANPDQFTGDITTDKYRVWGFDECGEGHWDFPTNAWVTNKPGDFTKLLSPPNPNSPNAPRTFVRRRRPGISPLFSLDALGKPIRAQLHIASNYNNANYAAGLWDGKTGTWQQVDTGDWHLLDDRLGFRLTAHDPNAWHAGAPPAGSPTAYDTGGLLSMVDWCAAPSAAFPFPVFRLTCRVQADVGLGISLPMRPASASFFPVTRRIDTSDRFRKRMISQFSAQNTTGKDVASDDDTDDATAFAAAVQKYRENGSFAGSATLHGIRLSYDVGDKINIIQGRNISLRQNVGAGVGESAEYPTVVARRWEFENGQTTVLQLQDRRAEPTPRRRKERAD